ncbi:putative dehydrogenase [Arthrobacter crystallopoietes BAB-32]|uniref:Putative dehydrogenase n=1 Tax=Arthrobacter crystallopoietes BAB-32 TaxID=1246476 RepID=N1V5U6_9MICC|nr:hypothetical protein [Arthrobacter crystallopoietes]EMY33628.1 putative dehydrogenase [Arthrobacter crystallopoietes BAB-32]
MLQFHVATGNRSQVDSVMPLQKARDVFAKMASGEVAGKIVLTH